MNVAKGMSVKLAMSCAVLFFGLSGCATMPGWISSSGASRQQVQERRGTDRIEGIQLVDVNDSLARRLAEAKKLGRFDAIFSQSGIDTHLVGPGRPCCSGPGCSTPWTGP
jgi:polysaccharide export outer membrane protein